MNKKNEFIAVNICVLTVSDTRTIKDDKSGDYLVDSIKKEGHKIVDRDIVKDDEQEIKKIVKKWVKEKIEVIITTGGTGFTKKDVTIEAIEPMFDKNMGGFSATFHAISYEKIGASTMQSRATAGLCDSTLIFCLPGSPSACKDAWEKLLKSQLDNRHKPCNFVEIMPRIKK